MLDEATLKLPAICRSVSSICARVNGARLGVDTAGGEPEPRRGVAAVDA